MKKICVFAAAIMMAVVCFFVLAACNGGAHDHVWGEGVVARPATCADEGEMRYECSICGAMKTEPIPATDEHTVVSLDDDVEPTCTLPGYTAGTYCSVCGLVFSGHVERAALGHDWGEEGDEGWQEVVAPTCLSTGLEKRVCERCGDFEQKAIDKLEHQEEILPEVDPDCTHSGLTEGVWCSVCHTVLEEQTFIPSLGHDYGEWEPVPNNADPDDYTHNFSAQHRHTCQRIGCGSIETVSCMFDQTEVPATCTTDGKHIHKCPDCGFEFEHVDADHPRLGHDYESSEYIREYDYEAGTFKHYRNCWRCSEPEETKTDCSFGSSPEEHAATCTTKAFDIYTCDVCHGRKTVDKGGELVPHEYYYEQSRESVGLSGVVYYHIRKCRNCNLNEELSCGIVRTEQAATCTEDGRVYLYCADCKRDVTVETIEARGHDYSAWEYDPDNGGGHHKKTCRREDCHDVVIEPCDMQTADKVPTCQSAGFDGTICSVCRHVEGNEVEQLFHTWSGYTQGVKNGVHYHTRRCDVCGLEETQNCTDAAVMEGEVAATCTTEGKKNYRCTVCDYRYSEATPNLGGAHNFRYEDLGDGHTVVCETCAFTQSTQHSYVESNVCACGHNSLRVVKQGATYVVAAQYSGNSTLKHLVIPESWSENGDVGFITSIQMRAFSGFTKLETVEIPYTVSSIAAAAFSGCPMLREVRIVSTEEHPSVLTTIRESAFSGCTSLVTVDLPDSLVELGDDVFSGCTSLKDITIPDSVKLVGASVFYDTAFSRDPSKWTEGGLYLNKMLLGVSNESVEQAAGQFVIRNGTTIVCAGAFRGCISLTDLEIPSSVKRINRNAFGYQYNDSRYVSCTNLARVRFHGDLQQWFGISFDGDYANPMHYAKSLHVDETADKVEIPQGVSSIPNGTFRGNTSITEIVIPATVTAIGDYAFEGCTALVRITIPDSVTEIGIGAFDNTPIIEGKGDGIAFDENGLLYVDHHLLRADPERASGDIVLAPETVTICAYAFKDCKLVTGITVGTKLMFIGYNAFKGLSGTLKSFKFLERTGGMWMCWTEIMGRGVRDIDLCGDSKAAANAANITNFYVGEWHYSRG